IFHMDVVEHSSQDSAPGACRDPDADRAILDASISHEHAVVIGRETDIYASAIETGGRVAGKPEDVTIFNRQTFPGQESYTIARAVAYSVNVEVPQGNDSVAGSVVNDHAGEAGCEDGTE